MADHDLKLVSPEGDLVPETAPFHNEGRTQAGWVLALGLMIAAVLVGAGLIAYLVWLWVAGLIVGAVSLAASAVLRAIGRGQPRVPAPELARSLAP